jgi:integrase/recombinase XerD
LEETMLEELRRRNCWKYRTLPFLGPVVDGFDDWLRFQGYALSTRKLYLSLIKEVDRQLKQHYRCTLIELTVEDWAACQRRLRVHKPDAAPVVGLLRRYLGEKGRLALLGLEPLDAVASWIERYAEYLGKVRGLEPKTIKGHRFSIARFVRELSSGEAGFVPERIGITDIEHFIDESSSGRSRATLQHVVAHVRGFLRFLEISEQIPPGMGGQIDTPRVYRLEQLPRALSWEVVETFLESIDRRQPMGLRDYAMFSLMAQYGLRCSEIAALRLEDFRWSARRITVSQRKTKRALVLPLTDSAATALHAYLRAGRRAGAPHRQVFLGCRAPYRPIGATAVAEAFRGCLCRSGLSIPTQGPHCLRHSFAVHLLRQGAALKEIGDLLGHGLAESTCMYLRLAVEDLREVALPLPSAADGKGVF